MGAVIAKILLAVAIVLAGLAIFVTAQPSGFRISRSAVIDAPPSAVFAQVNDFPNWQAWSPWMEMDPDAKATYAGPTSGKGAKFGWSGNSQVGEGSMTILESAPDSLVRIQLDFVRPFKATSEAEFRFEPAGQATRVTWTMTGKNNFIGKAINLVMDCDKMVGGQFEKGLAKMKKIVESGKSTNPL